MASKVGEDQCNTETDDGTLAFQKKRSRRVSFSEITSVHVFDRDDEDGTASDSKPSSNDLESGPPDHGLGFHHDSTDGEDSKDSLQNEEEGEDYDDGLDARRSFLRPIESPSPGSTFGSATSNEEDNFFGPVSASFIRPGRLSDSAASDENHDITMDSTAFSMHFRSLAKSDSGGDLKTPTSVHISFEEKTPTQNTNPTNPGSSMVLTVAKKPIAVSSTFVEKLSGSNDSSDMSLVEENPHRYDYGRLSFGLDTLLSEGIKDVLAVPLSDKNTISNSPMNMKNKFFPSNNHYGPVELIEGRENEMGSGDTSDVPAEAVSFAPKKLGDANAGSNSSPICQIAYGLSSGMHGAPASDASVDKQNCYPNQLNEGTLSGKSKTSNAFKMTPRSDFYSVNCGMPSNVDTKICQLDEFELRKCESPLVSMSSLSTNQRQTVLGSSTPSKKPKMTTPSQKQSSIFLRDEIQIHGESVSSIQKSISKLQMLDASPFSSTLKVNIDSTLISSEYLFKTPPRNAELDRKRKDAEIKCMDTAVAQCEDQLFIVAMENELGHRADLGENDRNVSPLTTVNKLDSLLVETSKSSSPLVKVNHMKGAAELETMDGREINLHALPDESGVIANFQTPLRNEGTNFQSVILDADLQIGTDEVRINSNPTGRWIKAPCRGSASPFIHRDGNEPLLQKVELCDQSPSSKGLCNVTHGDRMHPIVEDVLSPNTSQLRHGFENFSAQKRRREDVTTRGNCLFSEIARIQRSPKLHRSEGCNSEFLSEHCESNTEASEVRHEKRMENWADVFSKFLADTKQMILPSVDKLNLQAIGLLEDVLDNLQRLQIYEMLCTEIQSQKSFGNLNNLQRKRVAEMKLLLHRFVHEEAKLQLMRVKRERLLKKVQLLRSGIQESQMLKLNSLHLFTSHAKDADTDNSRCQLVNFEGIQEEEVVGDKVIALRQELDSLERNIMSLTKSFHTSCKMNGEPSCGDTILLVNDRLKKKACCRFICLNLQLWEVENLESMNGHHDMVLNYLGFIIQRFAINVGPASSMVISKKLNDVNILKKFPNMNVCTAFAFAFNANTTQKNAGSGSLSQETQVTSSVLGNLLDVVEEVQVARFELQNLTYTSFCSPSVGQLELHLHFINLKSGRKVALTLEMSCLKWGMYPWDILPSQLEGPADVTQKSPPEPLFAEVKAATQSLRVGYLRIIRLCRSVSQVVEAWNG